MDKKRALTLDPVLTKANIKKDGRSPASWARLRGYAEGTVYRILDGSYPYTADPESVYQQVLASFVKDGYLVESHVEHKAA
jgi:hypothetical protein